MSMRAIIADDHMIVRQGVRSIIEKLDNVEIVAEAATGIELIAAAKQFLPDLIVSDIAMPYVNGLEVVHEIRRWSPKSRILVLTGLTSHSLLSQADGLGVEGIFLKSDPPELVEQALKTGLTHGPERSPQVRSILGKASAETLLSGREVQVLHAIARGDTNAVIADRLGVSASTVDKHRTSLMRKLSVHSVAELLALALREGLLETSRHITPPTQADD